MKKTLALLTLSLLLVVATMLGVSATVVTENADAGIGAFICFDDQATIDATVNPTCGDIVYDATEGALKFTCLGNYDSTCFDNQINITWPAEFNNAAYPVLRVTYKSVVTDKDGQPRTSGASAHVWTVGVSVTSGNITIENNGEKSTVYHSTWSGTLANCTSSRIDIPNINTSAFNDADYVTYVYDIGFFKDQATAEAYTCDVTPSSAVATYTLNITGLNGVENATTTKVDGENTWNIVVPFGTDLSKATLAYDLKIGEEGTGTLVSTTEYSGTNASSYVHKDVSDLNLTQYATNKTPIKLMAYSKKVLAAEGITVNLSVATPDKTDAEIVTDILAELDKLTLDSSLFAAAKDANDIAAAVKDTDGYKALAAAYPTATLNVETSEFVAATPATAANPTGATGSCKVQFVAKYGTTKNTISETVHTVTIPVPPFRVLYMFNDQDMADTIVFGGGATAIKLNDNGKVPVVTVDGKSFARFEALETANIPDTYFYIGKKTDKPSVESDNYTKLASLDDYKYMLINYNSSATLPGAQHIYMQTDYHILNGTGYVWLKDSSLAYANMKKSVTNESLILDNSGFENGIYPWCGNITSIRMNVAKGQSANKGDYFDINYIAFFSTKAEAEAFALNPTVAEPLTAAQKSAIDAIDMDEASGIDVISADTANAYVLAKVKAALADEEYDSVLVNTVSYTQYDIDSNTKGEYKYTITVKQGDKLGDRDVYTTATKTMVVSVPVLTVDTAVEAISAIDFSNVEYAFTKTAAIDRVVEKISGIKAAYVGYTFEVIVTDFTAPTETTDGSFKFTVKVNDTKSTDEITTTAKAALAPIVYNYAFPITFYNTNFVCGTSGTSEYIIDDTHFGGGYSKFERTGTSGDFNLQLDSSKSGMPVIEDLEKYPVVLYRYKAPEHNLYQIYYYTSTTSGHTYQHFSPTKPVNVWNYHIWPTVNGAGGTGTSSTAWDGKVNSLRFDFFRYDTSANRVLELDYIGLFASEAQAEAFAKNPWLDSDATNEELATKYTADVKLLNNISAAPVFSNETALTAQIEALAKAQGVTNKFYYAITEHIKPVDGTEENHNGTDGSISFIYYFSESPTNANFMESNKITATIVAKPYISGVTTAELRDTDDSGLRFKTVFDKEWMQLVKTYGSITYGTLVAPTDALGDKELTLTTDLGDVEIADVDAVYHLAEDENSLTFTAVITGIPEAEKDTALTARAYAKFNYKGNDYVVYFDAVSSSLNAVSTPVAPAPVA